MGGRPLRRIFEDLNFRRQLGESSRRKRCQKENEKELIHGGKINWERGRS